MASKLIGKEIPFVVVFKNDEFILLEIEKYYAYKDGIRTDELAGYQYGVVDLSSFDKIKVKIPGQKKPLMSPDELAKLRENGDKVTVEFINGVVKLYNRKVGNTWSVEDSYSAEDIALVLEN